MKKRIFALLLPLMMLFTLTACTESGQASNGSSTNNGSQQNSSTEKNDNSDTSDPTNSENITTNDSVNTDTENGSRILVAFFSRADENYGVGYIEKGNTHIIADMIAEEVGADSFEIVRVTPYPKEYDACTDEAKTEKNAGERPELTAKIEKFSDYDTVFLGYPNWWGDMPMPVYTFLESYDFSGKTVIPFCTHAGSGLSGTVNTLRSKLNGATVLDGLAVAGTTAQNDQDNARTAVLDWLEKLDIK
ncbi:MAG: flavodoxin [Ruminococcaceae bacterium]|nr:flavodoxin [Oscillospiraceae bacterium]